MALAETVTEAANSWPAVALAIVGLVGGWGTLIIKTWVEARKNSATGDTVNEIKEQVVNGHDTNLREDVAEGLELMRFAVEFIKQLPNRDDINRIDGRIDTLAGRVAALELLKGDTPRRD